MLKTQTQGSSMVGADESTELWRHPNIFSLEDNLDGVSFNDFKIEVGTFTFLLYHAPTAD